MTSEHDSASDFIGDGSGNRDGQEDCSATASDAGACSREQTIAEAAYYRAERRGFTPEDALADWFQAEIDVEGTAP